MKYTTEEALAEILRRSEQVLIRRNRRAVRRLSGASGALLAVLVVVIGLFPGSGTASAGSVYGAFLLSREAGGYVLAAVIAFALGVTVTLLSLKQKRKNSEKSPPEKHRKEDGP